MTHRGDRTLAAAGLARVEGEGAMYVRVSHGQMEEVRLDIYEPPRFFEAFLAGRSYTEPPDITARICGICPVAYQTSACLTGSSSPARPAHNRRARLWRDPALPWQGHWSPLRRPGPVPLQDQRPAISGRRSLATTGRPRCHGTATVTGPPQGVKRHVHHTGAGKEKRPGSVDG